MSLTAVSGFIRARRSFLITIHSNIDGDALGAELAFARLLKKLGKSAVCVNDDAIPYGHEFLPGSGSIRRYREGMKLKPFDCLAVLDCSDLRRAGQTSRFGSLGAAVLNIDHHISNSCFGAVNWVEPHACCTCELIYKLYKHLRVPIDRQSAVQLYAGIVTDTGSFRYSNTQAATHVIAADLLAAGVKASEVYKKIYGSVPYDDMKLLSTILPTMQKDAGGRIVWFELPKAVLRGRGALSFDLSENLLNFARAVKGVEVAMLFKENQERDREVRVNFRSQGKTDVNTLAGLFGGGGHRTAAGMTIRGKTLEQVRKMVLAKVKEAVNGNNQRD
jgi:bifunctional oligoribonuclease and PAP phosphatase NrnA